MKARFLSLLAVVLCLVSCQRDADDLNVAMGGEQDVMLTVSLPEATRASSAEGFDITNIASTDYTLRYILEVYRVTESGVLYDTCQRFVETSDNSTMVFPVRLAPGYNYRIAAWADIVVDNGEKADRCYTTTNGLDAIEIIENMWKPMDETRDAYTGLKIINVFSSASDLDMELTRPFAKVRVVATDIADIRKVGLEPTTAVMSYSNDNMMYRTFNAVAYTENTSETDRSNAAERKDVEYTYVQGYYEAYSKEDAAEFTLFTDYIFVPASGTAKFTLDVYADATKTSLIKGNNFNTEIFVERNKLTTIKGDVLTTGGNIKVTVDNELGIKETYTYVDTAEDLQDKIKNATNGEETNISLGGDIDLGDLFSASTLSTRAAATLPIVIPEDKTIVLDLNGFTITTPWDDESAKKHHYAFTNNGTLTIKDSSENKTGKIIARGNFNYGTMTLESGTIEACDGNGGYGVRNYEGEFVMNGGAVIASYDDDNDRASGNNDATPIRVDEGATATITNGTITNICDYTFAIENHGTTTINGGSFTSVHSTVANYGTMTINGSETTIKCDGEYTSAHPIYTDGESSITYIKGGNIIANDKSSCYYVSVNNSTVYISGGTFTNGQAAFTGEGTIVVTGGQFDKDPSARVADGYKAEEANGVWTIVFDPAAKIGSTEYATLQEAFEVGGEITLLRNVTVAEPVVLAEGKTAVLDLNGKTLAAANDQKTYAINNHGNLTIKGNGTVNARGMYNGYNADGNYVTTAKLTIENGTFNAKGTDGGACVFNYGTVDINGGTFESVGGYGLNNQSGAVMTVDDASVRGGIYNSSGRLTVNANVYQHISGRHAIYNWAGSVEVNGGEFDSESGNELILADGKDATVVINDGTFNKTAKSWLFGAATGKNISFVINGGTHNGYVNMPEGTVDTIRPYGDPIAVMGGTFNFNPTTWVADGYKVVENNGRWAVVVDPVAKIGSTEYATLQEAFNVGGEITLLRDVTVAETVVLAEGKTVVLDLNGKTLSAVDMNTIKNNGGNLTIKNGTVTRTGDVAGYSVNNASGEIAVENATIERGLYTSGSKMTATNANISHEQSTRHAIYAWNCAVTINSGTFHNDNAGNATLMASGSSIVTINGGTFSIADGRSSLGWTSSMIDQNSTAQVVVKGGLFNGGFRINSADTELTIEGGEFNTNNGSAFTDYSGKKIVKGGIFTDAGAQNWAKKYLAEGYVMNANGEVIAE